MGETLIPNFSIDTDMSKSRSSKERRASRSEESEGGNDYARGTTQIDVHVTVSIPDDNSRSTHTEVFTTNGSSCSHTCSCYSNCSGCSTEALGSSVEQADHSHSNSFSEQPSEESMPSFVMPYMPLTNRRSASSSRSRTLSNDSSHSRTLSQGSHRSWTPSKGSFRSRKSSTGSSRSRTQSTDSARSGTPSQGSSRSRTTSEGSLHSRTLSRDFSRSRTPSKSTLSSRTVSEGFMRSKTPSESSVRSKTPSDGSSRSKTPLDESFRSKTPSNASSRSRTSSDGSFRSRTPSDDSFNSRTLTESILRSRTPSVGSSRSLSTRTLSTPTRRSTSFGDESSQRTHLSGPTGFSSSSDTKLYAISAIASEYAPAQVSETDVSMPSERSKKTPKKVTTPVPKESQEVEALVKTSSHTHGVPEEGKVVCVLEEPTTITSDFSLQVSPSGDITLCSRFYVHSASAVHGEKVDMYTVHPVLRHSSSTGDKNAEVAKNFFQMKVGKDRLYVERATNVSDFSGVHGDFVFSDRRRIAEICALVWKDKQGRTASSGDLSLDGRYKLSLAGDGTLSATESLFVGFDELHPCSWKSLEAFVSSKTYPAVTATQTFFYDEMVMVASAPVGVNAVRRVDVLKGQGPSSRYGLIEKRVYTNDEDTATDGEFPENSDNENKDGQEENQ